MADDVLVLAEHRGGQIAEVTFELLGRARQLAGPWGGRVLAVLLGDAALAEQLGAADGVLHADHPAFASYNPEAYARAVAAIVDEHQPRLVLTSTTTAGMDVSTALSVHWGAPLASYVVDIVAEGDAVRATCRAYGGKLLAEVELSGPRAVCAAIAGSFPAAAGRSDAPGRVDPFDPSGAVGDLKVSVEEVTEPEKGDVDITDADLLVAIGRGVGSRDNLDMVQELADALGAPLASSRPLVDQGWLPKSRQVGKSGLSVKPKVYLALGISGAPEHLEGIRDAELVVACNTDPKAPIFDVAAYGTTVDLFDLVDELVKQVQA